MPEHDKLIDRNRPKKLYVQVLEALRDEIESGKWSAGSQIPVEDELCARFEVSKAVIRQAILDLVRQGYLLRQQGKGTFVCRRQPPAGVAMTTAFEELMIEGAASLSTRVLAQTVMTPVDDLEEKFGGQAGQHLIYVKRVVSDESGPVLMAEAYIPYRLCPDLLHEELGDRYLTEIMEKKFKIQVSRIRIFIDITRIGGMEAECLGLARGDLAALLEQHFYSEGGQIMYMRIIKRTDRARFYREFEKK